MTVLRALTRSDGLRLIAASDSLEVVSCSGRGAVSGVTPQAVGGACAAGSGAIRWRSGVGLSWKAPGSDTYGLDVLPTIDGSYLLEDGEDAAAFVRIGVVVSWLPQASAQAEIVVSAPRRNQLAVTVTAATATSGGYSAREFTLSNVSPHRLDSVKVWSVEPLSQDGLSYSTYATEGAALSIGSIAPGSTSPLFVRYTVGAGSTADPDVASAVHASWVGE